MAAALAKTMSLRDVLEEQQEPFLLDIYLLEHGFSDRGLDDNKGGGHFCWPALSGGGNGGFRQREQVGGLLRSLLPKLLLDGKLICRKASGWGRRALLDHRQSGGGSLNAFDCFAGTAKFRRLSSASSSSLATAGGGSGGEECRRQCSDDSLPRSPVSVLDELHSNGDDSFARDSSDMEDGSTSSSNVSDDVHEELLLACASSLFLGAAKKKGMDPLKRLALDCEEEAARAVEELHGWLEPTEAAELAEELVGSWRNQGGNLTRTARIVGSDVSSSSAAEEWKHFRPELRRICVEIGDEILGELEEEAVLEFIVAKSCL